MPLASLFVGLVVCSVFFKGSEVVDEEIMEIFLKERQTNGDFISKASDMLWRGEALKFANSETITVQENIQELDQVPVFLKLLRVIAHFLSP